MAQKIITLEDLQKFRLQLLEDLRVLFQQPNHSQKQWLKSSEVRKMLGISHGTLQNLRIKNLIPYQRIGGLMFYKYDDIIKLLEGNKQSNLSVMDRLQELALFMHELASDIRLKPVHLLICLALFHAWVRSNFQNSFQVSRSKLMRASQIQSRATYHKVMKDLQAFGYLKYNPSYHPVKGSSACLNIRDFERNQGVSKVSNDLARGQAHF